MTIPTRSAGSTPGARLFVLMLIAAILTWGVGYKISLYSAPQTSQTSIPPARLLAHRICLLDPSHRSGSPDGTLPASALSDAFPSAALTPIFAAWRFGLPREPLPDHASSADTLRHSRPPPLLA